MDTSRVVCHKVRRRSVHLYVGVSRCQVCMPWKIRDGVAGFTTGVASEAGFVIVAFSIFVVRAARSNLCGIGF